MKTWTLSLMQCHSRSSSKASKSSNKVTKDWLFMLSALDNTTVPKLLTESKPIWRPIKLENISVSWLSCTQPQELLQLSAVSQEQFMDLIVKPLSTLFNKLQTKEEKSTDRYCQKYQYCQKSILTRNSNCVTSWRRSPTMPMTISLEKDKKVINSIWLPRANLLPKNKIRKFSSSRKVTISGKLL